MIRYLRNMCYNKQEQLFRTVQFTHLYVFRNRFENILQEGDTVIKKEMIAMLLAGGQGSRLGVLTSKVANRQLHLEASTVSLIFH